MEVAPDLLGRTLVRALPDGSRLAGRIVEVEAYEPGDAASHGNRRMTDFNACRKAVENQTSGFCFEQANQIPIFRLS